jgi:LacI family transcriptional regulator
MSIIARKAGVGKATVSLALRNDPRLRPETRERIQEIARSMGYQANAVVSNLMAQLRAGRDPRYQSTLAILNAANTREGMSLSRTSKNFIKGVKEHSAGLGYGTDEFWLYEPNLCPERLRQILRTRNIRGAIIAGVTDHRKVPREFDPLWQDLACVVIGIRPESPELHFACNDHYSTARHAGLELKKLGYRRPGFVMDAVTEEITEYRFSAGLFSNKAFGDFSERVPWFEFSVDREAAFQVWLRTHKPDVLVTIHPEIRGWVKKAGLQCPKEIGLLHLDVSTDTEGWSGMDQNNEAVGALAVDIVIAQLHRNEAGLPAQPICMMTESRWISGTTLRDLTRSRKKAKESGK